MAMGSSYSQQQPNTKPLPPTLDRITVNPGTGYITVFWTPPAFNPLHPIPIGYIVYKRYTDHLGNTGMVVVDSVDATTTSFTDSTALGNTEVSSYTVASFSDTEPSAHSHEHYTILVTASYDSCAHRVNLNWSHYRGWGNRIQKYTIHVGTVPQWETFQELEDAVSGSMNEYSYPAVPDAIYYFYITAYREESNHVSQSNLVGINTRIAKWPSYISIDSVIAHDLHRQLFFSIDTTSELNNFNLVRWEYSDSVSSIFTAKRLYEFSSPRENTFTDTTDAWSARSRPFYYKLNAIDGCRRICRVSNLANTVTLRAIPRGKKITLEWDVLHAQSANQVSYNLYRIAYQDTQLPPELIYQSSGSMVVSFVDDLTPLQSQNFQAQFCYYVDAIERDFQGRTVMLSRSRSVCVEATPDVVMPNAINPLSGVTQFGTPRNYFSPTISFNAPYVLTIYNRWGGVIFNGRNQGWNGYLSNGDLAKQGAYVYRVEVMMQNGKSLVRTGSVTVFYGK